MSIVHSTYTLTDTVSGKSSLVLLLSRFLNPTPNSGGVTIDNLHLAQIPPSLIRERIITLPQTPFLLTEGSSIRKNLELNISNHSDPDESEALNEVLQTVGMWDFVQDRGGVNSELKVGSLSHGEKSLLCLARAVLRKRLRDKEPQTLDESSQPKSIEYWNARRQSPAAAAMAESAGGILILDEFNARLDRDTDNQMQAVIRREFAGWTVLCVAHRLESIMDYDRVVVMEKGKIVEEGEPGGLRGRQGSKFGELVRAGRAGGDDKNRYLVGRSDAKRGA